LKMELSTIALWASIILTGKSGFFFNNNFNIKRTVSNNKLKLHWSIAVNLYCNYQKMRIHASCYRALLTND
jgi:hypothetical protein